MKLSEIKGDDAFDVLADLIDPVTRIMADEKVQEARKNKLPRLAIIKMLLKTHKRDLTEILAILEMTPVEEYEVSLTALPMKVNEVISDPAFAELFPLQSQKAEETSFGSAMENTEVEES